MSAGSATIAASVIDEETGATMNDRTVDEQCRAAILRWLAEAGGPEPDPRFAMPISEFLDTPEALAFDDAQASRAAVSLRRDGLVGDRDPRPPDHWLWITRAGLDSVAGLPSAEPVDPGAPMVLTPDPEALRQTVRRLPMDFESLTVLLVAGPGATVATVRGMLGLRPDPVDPGFYDEELTSYTVVAIDGGVLALEHSGYGDPSNDVLAALSQGGTAAVTRSNIQGHVRFGCATQGALDFDSDAFCFIREHEKAQVPDRLRSLFDTAWIDLDAEITDDDPGPVGLAMVLLHTGLTPTTGDIERALADDYLQAPSLAYP